MASRHPLAALAELGQAMRLLAANASERTPSESPASTLADSDSLIRVIVPPEGNIQHEACWRRRGRVRVAEARTREDALRAIEDASGRGGGSTRVRPIEIRDVRIAKLSPEDTSTAVDLLASLVNPEALQRALEGRAEAEASEDIDAAA